MTHDAAAARGPARGASSSNGSLPPSIPPGMAPSVVWDPRLEPAPGPVLALDFGGTHLRSAVVTADGAVHGRQHGRTPAGGAEAVIEASVGALERSITAYGRADEAFVGLGISAPGPIDVAHGVLIDPPNLDRSFWGLPLAARLAERLGVPARVERDTHVAALAEAAFGAARGATDFVYLTISTGIGGAVVTGGRLMVGPDGVAGELGHLTVDMDGPVCGCGARGHLERLSSGSGMAASAREAREAGRDTPILRDLAARLAPAGLEARHLADAEALGDALAHEILERGRQAFAAAMVSIVDVFDPQLVVCGGGVTLGQGERLLAPARDAVRDHAFRIQARRARIVTAALGDDVGLVGALPLVRAAVSYEALGAAAARPSAALTPNDDRVPDATVGPRLSRTSP